jgi:hypothetical protein
MATVGATGRPRNRTAGTHSRDPAPSGFNAPLHNQGRRSIRAGLSPGARSRYCIEVNSPATLEQRGNPSVAISRKGYSIFGALLMLQFLFQLYSIAAALFTIVNADDNAKDVYAAFKGADGFAGLHAINGDLIGVNLLIMLGLSFGSRYPWRTTILTGVLFVLLVIQLLLAHTGIPVISALHGINAVIMVGLGGYLTGRNWAFGRGEAKTPAADLST